MWPRGREFYSLTRQKWLALNLEQGDRIHIPHIPVYYGIPVCVSTIDPTFLSDHPLDCRGVVWGASASLMLQGSEIYIKMNINIWVCSIQVVIVVYDHLTFHVEATQLTHSCVTSATYNVNVMSYIHTCIHTYKSYSQSTFSAFVNKNIGIINKKPIS